MSTSSYGLENMLALPGPLWPRGIKYGWAEGGGPLCDLFCQIMAMGAPLLDIQFFVFLAEPRTMPEC